MSEKQIGEVEETKTVLDEGGVVPEAVADTLVPMDDVAQSTEPGVAGWLNLAGAVMINSICYGMTNSFGVFQEYYSIHFLSTTSTTSISWIGSIQLCLCPLLGCISGPLFDSGHLKPLIASGGLLYVFSLMMASISTQYYQILLSHGFGVGLAMGIIFSPSVSTLSHHFGHSRWKSLAYGCTAAGSSLGGIIYPVSLRYLLPALGFAWGMRIMAFIVLLVATSSFFCLSTVHPPRRKVAILSPTVFRNAEYTVFVLGVAFCSLAIYGPLTFGVTFASSKGLSSSLAFYSLAISNGCSIFGRIMPLLIAQRIGPLNVAIAAGLFSSIMLFSWTRANSASEILAFDALYGVPSGAYAAAVNPSAASFAPMPDQIGYESLITYLGQSLYPS
ncbi:MAG: hypothetical protein TREMPRED_005267 [Tremellales sp. Tagirdzhanova-0007]|nr:MAG: hypothetical protein TREMPRED_005267 [Tremellales sp. Tagirdzhanova-0007]